MTLKVEPKHKIESYLISLTLPSSQPKTYLTYLPTTY